MRRIKGARRRSDRRQHVAVRARAGARPAKARRLPEAALDFFSIDRFHEIGRSTCDSSEIRCCSALRTLAGSAAPRTKKSLLTVPIAAFSPLDLPPYSPHQRCAAQHCPDVALLLYACASPLAAWQLHPLRAAAPHAVAASVPCLRSARQPPFAASVYAHVAACAFADEPRAWQQLGRADARDPVREHDCSVRRVL